MESFFQDRTLSLWLSWLKPMKPMTARLLSMLFVLCLIIFSITLELKKNSCWPQKGGSVINFNSQWSTKKMHRGGGTEKKAKWTCLSCSLGEDIPVRGNSRHKVTKFRATWGHFLTLVVSLRSVHGPWLLFPCVLFFGKPNHHCTFNSQVFFLKF